MSETVRVKYQFCTQATLRGQMNIPKEMFDRCKPGLAWSDEIEEHIIGMHDYVRNPPEIDPEFDVDFDDIDVVKTESI